jgi:hypothetical protein
LSSGGIRGAHESVVQLFVERADLESGGGCPGWVAVLDGFDIRALSLEQQGGLQVEILVHLRLRQAQLDRLEAPVRDLRQMVLRESQVEVRGQALLSLDFLAVGQHGTEGLLCRVQVAQAGLGEASPRKSLDAIVG